MECQLKEKKQEFNKVNKIQYEVSLKILKIENSLKSQQLLYKQIDEKIEIQKAEIKNNNRICEMNTSRIVSLEKIIGSNLFHKNQLEKQYNSSKKILRKKKAGYHKKKKLKKKFHKRLLLNQQTLQTKKMEITKLQNTKERYQKAVQILNDYCTDHDLLTENKNNKDRLNSIKTNIQDFLNYLQTNKKNHHQNLFEETHHHGNHHNYNHQFEEGQYGVRYENFESD